MDALALPAPRPSIHLPLHRLPEALHGRRCSAEARLGRWPNRLSRALRPRSAAAASAASDHGKPIIVPDAVAIPPTWGETLRGSFFWADTSHWHKVPSSWYWTAVFVLFKVVGTIGGFRGRAHFARRARRKDLDRRRAEASAVVDATAAAALESFPAAAQRVATHPPGEKRVALAVVIPAFARSAADVAELRATLAALAAQTRRPDVVVLVDDASLASLAPALGAWPDADGLVSVRMGKNVGPAGARSVGLRLLRRWAGEHRVIACFTDSDAAPTARWCEAMLAAQRAFPGIISGSTLSKVDCHTGRFHDHFGSLNGRWTWDDAPAVLIYGCTCNFSVDLLLLGDIEFDPVFSRPGFEDIELCWRARCERNVLTRYCEGAVVHHEYDRGLIGIYKQFWKYGNTEPLMAWMHPDFTFQGSRAVIAGFDDPRVQALRNSIPDDAADRAQQIFERLKVLYKAPEPHPEPR